MKKGGWLILAGALAIFGILVWLIVSNSSTVKAVVPNQTIQSGVVVDESMLTMKDVPSQTPKGFITDPSAVVGQIFKSPVAEGQLLYTTNIMSAWNTIGKDENSIPKDYVVTTIQIPSERSMGGLITVGDYVDVLGVPNSNYSTATPDTFQNALGEMATQNYYGANGINIYWVLSNVKILESNSALANANGGSVNDAVGKEEGKSSTQDTTTFVVALSYDDYKKLRLSEQYFDLWMNISPEDNKTKGPDLGKMNDHAIKPLDNSMSEKQIKALQDSMNQSKNSKKK